MGMRAMDLRRVVVVVLGSLAATLLTAPAAVSQEELRIATGDTEVNPTTDSVLTLAEDLGLFEKHGVKVTVVPLSGTPQAVAALNSGDIDLANIGIDAAIRLRAENNVPIRGIVSVGLGIPYVIAAKDGIGTVKDLAGKAFAIADNGSLDHILTQAVLNSMDVPTDAPQYVAIGSPSARVQALMAGRVDATTVSIGTFLSVGDAPGIKILVDTPTFANATPSLSKFVAALESTIAAKPEALQRFVDAILEASRTFQSDPAKWTALMAEKRDDLSPESLAQTAELLAGRWCVNGCIAPDAIEKAVTFTYNSPDFEGVPTVAPTDLVDLTFNDKALGTAGIYQGDVLDAR